MRIHFTYKQIAPTVALLRKYNLIDDKHRPAVITPARWKRLLAGRLAQLEFVEIDALARSLGWELIFDGARDHPKQYARGPRAKK